MRNFRWWLFNLISRIGWWVCPEPHKSALGRVWKIGMANTISAVKREEEP